MATITVRALGANNDPLEGQGRANFISDLDAVAQIIRTRLLLFEGEWWEDVTEGTPWWQKILGFGGAGRNQQTIALLIGRRIAGSPFVISLSNVAFAYDPSTRQFQYQAAVKTAFGTLLVTNQPQPPNRALPQSSL